MKIEKDQPGGSDVHVQTAGGSSAKKPKKPAGLTTLKADPAIANDAMPGPEGAVDPLDTPDLRMALAAMGAAGADGSWSDNASANMAQTALKAAAKKVKKGGPGSGRHGDGGGHPEVPGHTYSHSETNPAGHTIHTYVSNSSRYDSNHGNEKQHDQLQQIANNHYGAQNVSGTNMGYSTPKDKPLSQGGKGGFHYAEIMTRPSVKKGGPGSGPNGGGSLKDHPNYSKSDHDHLKSKGYSNKEIAAIWDNPRQSSPQPGPAKQPDLVGRMGRTYSKLSKGGPGSGPRPGSGAKPPPASQRKGGRPHSEYNAGRGGKPARSLRELKERSRAQSRKPDHGGKSHGSQGHSEHGGFNPIEALAETANKSVKKSAQLAVRAIELVMHDSRKRIAKEVPIMKSDKCKQIVYGVVLEPDMIDAQDDFMTAEDIEEAAHKYLIDSRVVGSGHTKAVKAGVVESYIAPTDFEGDGQYGKQTVKKGSWVLGVKVFDPNEWQKVEEGEYQSFSVGGFGLRTAVK